MILETNGKDKKTIEKFKVNEDDERVVIINDEIEEGQIVEQWLDTTQGMTSRSPTKRALKYGELKLLTPSRYEVLNEVNENGDLIDQNEKQKEIVIEVSEVEEKEEEDISIILVNNEDVISEIEAQKEDGRCVTETNKEEEGCEIEANKEVESNEANKENDIRDVENNMEEVQKEEMVKSPTYCEIVRSDAGKVTPHKSTNAEKVQVIRPSLPRTSKTFHKVFPESSVPVNPGRKVTRKAYI